MNFRLLLPIFGLLVLLACSLAAQQPDTLKHSLPAPPTGAQTEGLLGYSVAVDGNYTVVGAPFDDLGATDSGVVKVFHTVTGALLYVIPNPTPAVEDQFGCSVAIFGTRVVVGAWRDNTGAADAGCAYVYDLAGANPTVPVWTLSNPGPATSDYFGISVGISGARVVVGVWRDDVGAANAGSACVYDLSSASPTVPMYVLNNPSPAADDQFGYAVAIDGMRVVIGCHGDDTGLTDAGSAYVYDLSSGTPTVPVLTLNNPGPATGDFFGYTVAISGTRVAVGAPWDDTGSTEAGSAYVYNLAGATPTTPVVTMNNPTPSTFDWFGSALAISGTRVLVGTYLDNTGGNDVGSAYVYDLNSATPHQPATTLNNPSPAANDQFGIAVAMSGTRVVVGACYDDAGAVDAGSAYVYDLSGGTPTVPLVTMTNPGPLLGGLFGSAIAVSGTRVVVGAYLDDTGAVDAGSAYVYDLASATPTLPVVTLNNPDPAANDQFGISVAISGARVVIGANLDDTGASNAGRAYVYDLSSGVPTTPMVTLNNPAPAAGDSFGISVAISGTRVVVGANLDDAGTTDAGNAYVYDLNSGTPATPTVTLNNPTPAVGDNFGVSVAISGTRVVVGANLDDAGATDAGRAYVYDVGGGTPTTPTVTLNNPAPAVGDNFGISVAISGTCVVVGANLDDAGTTNAGSVYVYDVSSGTPATPTVTLNKPAPAVGDNFGISVAISGTRVVVGANLDDAGVMDAGSAYVYDVSGGTPTQPVATLTNPGPAVGDWFGYAVAIDGTTAAVGVPYDDTVITDKGFAYVFGPETTAPANGTMTLAPASPVAANAALTVTFAGWTDASLPLTYTLLIDDAVISPAGTSVSRNVTAPATPGVHSLQGRIADAAGNVTEVTQSFTVLAPQESWRWQHFGIATDTGAAADLADPDGDGQNNLFEFVAARLPNDPASCFQVRVEPVAGQPGQKAIIFRPVIAGRSYEVASKASLTDPTWEPLTNFTTSDNGSERTVVDLGAGTGRKFYTVKIVRPQGSTVLTPLETWRLLYFGLTTNTGNAADTADQDGDGQNNLFEFVAGLVPNNPASRLQVRVEAVPGQPVQKAIIFSPRLADRTYVVKYKLNLADAAWTALPNFTTSDNGSERTVIDLGVGAGSRFYTVEIVRP